VGTGDADILVSLADKHRPTAEYTRALRDKLTVQFPGTEFYYLPTDMVSQILNFGLPAQIDVQLAGLKVDENRALAEQLMQQIGRVQAPPISASSSPSTSQSGQSMLTVRAPRRSAIASGMWRRTC